MRLERRNLGRKRAADRHRHRPVRAPALRLVEPVDHPFRQRSRGRDADLLALEIGHIREARIIAGNEAHELGRSGDHCDADHRRALGDEAHVGAAADRDVDAAGDQRLLLLRAAGEVELCDVEPLGFEKALVHADIERHKAELLRHHLADAQRLGVRGRACQKRCRGKDCCKAKTLHCSHRTFSRILSGSGVIFAPGCARKQRHRGTVTAVDAPIGCATFSTRMVPQRSVAVNCALMEKTWIGRRKTTPTPIRNPSQEHHVRRSGRAFALPPKSTSDELASIRLSRRAHHFPP